MEFEDAEKNLKYGLHDVILDYCAQAPQFGENARYELYDREFLSYVWTFYQRDLSGRTDITTEEALMDGRSALTESWLPEMFEESRPWWRVLSFSEEFSELHDFALQNLYRHLMESAELCQAVGLLSHMGRTKLRIAHGGINALNADFSLVTNAIQEHAVMDQDRKACDDALHGMMTICDMVRRASLVRSENGEGLPTHAYSYLVSNENKLPLVERCLHSHADIESGPWLKPTNASAANCTLRVVFEFFELRNG